LVFDKNIPFKDPAVEAVFNAFPEDVRPKLLDLRRLIFEVAEGTEGVPALEETLRWGEPSYIAKKGSTLRLGPHKTQTDQYCLFFTCRSILAETFRDMYGPIFLIEDNRSLVFDRTKEIPLQPLKHCICLALTYHDRKHLPRLGT